MLLKRTKTLKAFRQDSGIPSERDKRDLLSYLSYRPSGRVDIPLVFLLSLQRSPRVFVSFRRKAHNHIALWGKRA